jgi:hypothetical protein
MLRGLTRADAQTSPALTDGGWKANSGFWISNSGHPSRANLVKLKIFIKT